MTVVHQARFAPEPKPFVQGSESLTSLLLSAGHMLELRLDQDLHAHGLTLRQYRALRYIGENPCALRSEIADALQVSPQAVGALCRRMSTSGLVERMCRGRGHPACFMLTTLGHRTLEQTSGLIAESENEILENLSLSPSDSLVAKLTDLVGQMCLFGWRECW